MFIRKKRIEILEADKVRLENAVRKLSLEKEAYIESFDRMHKTILNKIDLIDELSDKNLDLRYVNDILTEKIALERNTKLAELRRLANKKNKKRIKNKKDSLILKHIEKEILRGVR